MAWTSVDFDGNITRMKTGGTFEYNGVEGVISRSTLKVGPHGKLADIDCCFTVTDGNMDPKEVYRLLLEEGHYLPPYGLVERVMALEQDMFGYGLRVKWGATIRLMTPEQMAAREIKLIAEGATALS